MDNEPSTSMHILISNTLGLTVEFEFEVAGRQDVKRGRCSILDDEGGLLGFGDDAAESRECLGNGFLVRREVR